VINLLPPSIKEEIHYSRRNATLMHYLSIAVLTSLVLAGALLGARYYLDQKIHDAEATVKQRELTIRRHKKLETDAKSLNARLASIQTIQKSQAKFSLLLSDLAQFMPKGTAISSVSLTGDDKKPVRLTVDSLDYKTALGFRDSITRSKRISAADIEDIHLVKESGKPNTYKVTVTFAFNPGEAK
jgi:Tfp pilus assembly protein PilN